MVTSTKGVSKEIASDKVHQKEPTDSGFHESGPDKNRSSVSMSSKDEACEVEERHNHDPKHVESQSNNDGSESIKSKLSNKLDLINSTGSKSNSSLSNQERESEAIIAKEESCDKHQRPSPPTEVQTCQSNQEGSSVSLIAGKELEDQNHNLSPHTGSTVLESNQEGSSLSIIPINVSKTSPKTLPLVAAGPAPESDQENFIVALRPEKALDKLPLRRNPDSIAHASHSDEGVTFSRVPEKPTVDGYNWRKYGQKLVRGNTFVRSYYKCTFTNCPARKQVERSHDGHITEINYLWKHEHPKPPHTLLKGSAFVPPIRATGSDEPSLSTSEGHSSLHHATSHDPEASETPRLSMVGASENFVEVSVSQSSEIKSEVLPPDPKRQKREGSSVNDNVVTKTNCEPRVVVQTTSEVDIVNDGYRWRKYGQKLVKGNPNPRSYYRCSSAGCPVKKHVERASHDEKVVITTYEGRHDHDMPSGGRTVTSNTSGNNTGTTTADDEDSRPDPGASESTGMEMVVHVNAN